MAPPPVVARCCWAPSGDPASPGRVRHTSRDPPAMRRPPRAGAVAVDVRHWQTLGSRPTSGHPRWGRPPPAVSAARQAPDRPTRSTAPAGRRVIVQISSHPRQCRAGPPPGQGASCPNPHLVPDPDAGGGDTRHAAGKPASCCPASSHPRLPGAPAKWRRVWRLGGGFARTHPVAGRQWPPPPLAACRASPPPLLAVPRRRPATRHPCREAGHRGGAPAIGAGAERLNSGRRAPCGAALPSVPTPCASRGGRPPAALQQTATRRVAARKRNSVGA